MAAQKYPKPTVGALILSPGGELFLMRSAKWRGNYVIPGGHVELGERLEDALRREVKKETGLGIHDVRFVCFQEPVHDIAFWEKRHFVFFDYACRAASTEVLLNDEAEEYVSASVEDALRLPIDAYTERAIREYQDSFS